jgi:pantetheine-phosphate adenylyltransferase
MSDFEYEFQMALLNKDLCHDADTVFLSANAASMFLSSSAVKQIAQFGGDISPFVSQKIADDIIQICKNK